MQPRLHLCGHLHRAQERILKDGRKVINVGATPEGSIVLVEFDPKRKTLEARLESFAHREPRPATPGQGFCERAVVTSTVKPGSSFDAAAVPLRNVPNSV